MKSTIRIGAVFCISLSFFIAEIIGALESFTAIQIFEAIHGGESVGFRTKSLVLIADAFHYLNDIVAYAIAFIAASLHEKGNHNASFTFAFHRAELVGAFFNGIFLLALALSIFLQSIERFINLERIESPVQVLVIGCIGLFLNIISALVVHDHHGGHTHDNDIVISAVNESDSTQNQDNAHIHAQHNHTLNPPVAVPQHNLNLVGVLIHLFGDAINNIAVIFSAIVIWKLSSPNRYYADPAASLFISIIIFGSAIPMTMKAGHFLLEAAPLFIDLEKVKGDLLLVPKVLSVHDLHVWHLSQPVILASLHVCVPHGTTLEEWEQTETYLQHCFSAYGISHVTISPEIQRGNRLEILSNDPSSLFRCRLPSQDEFGCAVHELKKRKPAVVTV